MSLERGLEMKSWQWWLEKPQRIVMGVILLIILLFAALIIVKYLLLPLLAGALVIIVLVAIIRYALTGRIGGRGSGS
ncbi:hypothetical protein HY857_02315 [Candidatus Saccharibacteria bacterium]|nr:hypothetical protein [Candidatus Saccharibacteria bacterium]